MDRFKKLRIRLRAHPLPSEAAVHEEGIRDRDRGVGRNVPVDASSLQMLEVGGEEIVVLKPKREHGNVPEIRVVGAGERGETVAVLVPWRRMRHDRAAEGRGEVVMARGEQGGREGEEEEEEHCGGCGVP